ncbi:hypothetical protein BDZ45DRAFT_333474 [Acephala macrosclerotiorum]|nr:hypothetical protein BDZ45DRAFT_333474 [Acephala macrosclerotiorum]
MLCINQGNLSERSQQVAIMSSIYKEAASVTVWLGGDPKANSDVLFHDEAEDLDIFVELLQKHSSSEDKGLAQQWATMCSNFSEKDEYDDSDWNEIADWTFEILYKSVAKDLYLMYSSIPEETTELIRTRKLKRPVDAESYFYDTILNRNSLVLRLATFLSLDHESQFDIKHEVSWQNLFNVLQRWHKIIFSPWFGRVWVIQEIVNGKTVRVRHCNTQTNWNLVVNYHLIYKTLNSAWSDRSYDLTFLLPNFSMYFRDGLMQWYSLWENIDNLKQKQLSFWRILIATNDFLSTDPRDKIYALAPLASEIDPEELVPDYSKSVESVFSAFTWWYIQGQESLKLLSLCRHFHQKESTYERGFRRLENLPSWTPDYRKIPYLQICMNADRTSLYCADGEQPVRVLYDEDSPTSLHVEGVSVARVVNVMEVQGDGFWAQPWGDIKDLGPSPLKPKQLSTTDRVSVLRKNHLTLERYFQTLSASATVGPPQLAAFAQMALDINQTYFMKTSWSEDHFLRKCNTEAYHLLELGRRFQLYTVATTENNLFVSHDNRLGLGPKEMKEGDLVVILSGSGVPFILREKKLRENATREELANWLQDGPIYQLIGECYLDGRMHGEIFEDPLFEDPLHIDPLDRDSLLYPDLEGGRKGEQGRKGVYRAKMFHLK